jgi:general secretion pathway protein I
MSANSVGGAGRTGGGGFTLIEVVVAVLVLALSMSAILQLIAGGLGATRRAEIRATAALLAQSRLAAIGAGLPIAPGEAEDSFDNGYVWRETIEPIDAGDVGAAQMSQATLYRVSVSVYSGPDRAEPEITLNSLRLAPVEP